MAQVDLEESMVGQVLAIVIVFPILALVTVILRLFTRFFVLKNPSREDACITFAMILSIGITITIFYELRYGLGRHIAAVDKSLLESHFKSLFASIIVYNLGLTITKLSILLQYLRISVKPGVRKAIWALIIFVIAYGIETLLAGFFQCHPVAFFWNPMIPGGKCVNKFALYFANAWINIGNDFLILSFPILILKDLQMQRRQKFILIAIISLGGIACVASIIRLHLLYQFETSTDLTWDGTGAATWSTVEINVGIICGSISTLRPLLSRFFPNLFGSRDIEGTGTDPNNYVSSNYSANAKPGRFSILDNTLNNAGLRSENTELSSIRSREQG